VVVRIDPTYYRPTEVDQLLGYAEKARRELGWAPATRLDVMVQEMVAQDLAEARRSTEAPRPGLMAPAAPHS
jgi:GDPmannose 4,6-dehydratase